LLIAAGWDVGWAQPARPKNQPSEQPGKQPGEQPGEQPDPELPRSYTARRSPTPGLRKAQKVAAESAAKSTPAADGEGCAAGDGKFFNEISDTVLGYQKALSEHMPSIAAWAILSAPLWIVLLLTLVHRARRARLGGAAGARGGKGKDRGSAADKPRKLTQAELRARKAESTRAKALDDTFAGKSKGRVRRKTKVQDEPVEPLKLTPAQQILMLEDGRRPSLHETFCILGADMDAIEGLRRAAREELDPAMWAAAISFKDLEALRPFRKRWVSETAALRIGRWLSEHPMVTRDKLHVTMPARLQLGELEGMTLTQSSGLGVELAKDQQQLIERARLMLRQVCKEAENPYVILTAAREAEVPELMGGTQDEDLKELSPYRTALLLHGMTALDHGVQARLSARDGFSELKEAFEEHQKLVDTPVPAEGSAAHALHAMGGTKVPGMGTFLAAVAGAAYSAGAVVLKISKLAADVAGAERHDALVRLGELTAQALEEKGNGDGRCIRANLNELVGVGNVEALAKRSAELARRTEKLNEKQSIWSGESEQASPDREIAQLHQALVAQHRAQSVQVQERTADGLEKLTFAGQDGSNQQIAHRRVGYAMGGVGMTYFKGGTTEILSASREVVSMINQP